MTTETDPSTVEVAFAVDSSVQDELVAELDRLGFDAYLQDDDELRAYIRAPRWTPALDAQVRSVLDKMSPATNPRVATIPPQNWNQQWESTVEPIVVGSFIVTPSWKRDTEREKGLIPLEIDPKMSFGTGYHATTRLILRMMPSIVQPFDRVLDAGTGTGILAIAAARLGASFVLGVDIDPWSERNAKENCERNGVADVVRIQLKDVASVEDRRFDVILANIQLDVIVESLAPLKERLAVGGLLLVSGILQSQAGALMTEAERFGLKVGETQTEGEWWAAEVLPRRSGVEQ